MAISTTKYIFITILIFLSMKIEILIQGQQVPCLFFFGDSLFDNGNTNMLKTILKANYPPNGIDYPGGIPTGRYSNGRNVADFFAQLLGFSTPISPFATSRGSDILKGVNYASGDGGILDVTGAQVGERISLNKQLQNHQVTIKRILGLLGNQTAVDNHLHQCLYVFCFGNEDYVNNYYFPLSPIRPLYTPDGYAKLLVQKLSQQLKALNNLGSRKVVVYGLTKVGCLPEVIIRYPPINGSPCVDSVNDGVELFNKKLFSLLNNLNTNLTDSHFTYVNITDLSSANPSAVGTIVNNAACCKVGVTGLCVRNGVVCSNRDDHYYWDNYHPTEIVHKVFGTRGYNTTTI
ncbi:hypothetical protein ACS0TY_031530 [Phlomoides rotata]